MHVLHRLLPKREFRLPPFELVPLEFDAVGDEQPGELLLDEAVAILASAAAEDSEGLAMPTPRELKASIEHHLRDDSENRTRSDAAEELRNALAELRRAVR
jgi:hypothetical protein